jgi:hypothetical protein
MRRGCLAVYLWMGGYSAAIFKNEEVSTVPIAIEIMACTNLKNGVPFLYVKLTTGL